MIYYSNRQLWRLLCHAHGSSLAQRSVLARSLLLALFAAALAALRHFVLLPRGIAFLRDANPALQHAVDIATGLLALLLVSRLYAAHQQWQKGVDSVSAVGEAARTLLSSACSFVHFSKRETLATAATAGEDASSSQKAIRSKSQFIRDLKRYVLIYVTLLMNTSSTSFESNPSASESETSQCIQFLLKKCERRARIGKYGR
uniref:Uncharacterized protein n=1 Tax=Globisporangium ultimum (strain ATCC 200006 / CBS 805.95 / DAOM BR144) TaxID=431595 RepID=K3WIH3_GLOUD